ncbi:MAG: hypothetical protein JWP10_1802 [Nocardioidaceae bacterium]|nr:hypothetical protein [Nocardioidaceae bacterium]
MAIARYKALCIDVNDEGSMSRFWADTLGLTIDRDPDGDVVLTGPTPAHTVWPCVVPEPKSVKHRVHLDINALSPESFAGLKRLSGTREFPWTVFEDPEGGEFCVFLRRSVPDYKLYEIVVDCADAPAIAGWWADVLGAELAHHDLGFSYLTNMDGVPFSAMSFVPVPEPKSVKNRIHGDVTVGRSGVADLVARGAVVLRRPDDAIDWTVLADPEGNEFCAFVVE